MAEGDPLVATFQYQSGSNGLDITAVELLADGKPVAEDRHPGFTGSQSRSQVFKLALPKASKAAFLSLRVTAKGSGGDDSRGEIAISHDR